MASPDRDVTRRFSSSPATKLQSHGVRDGRSRPPNRHLCALGVLISGAFSAFNEMTKRTRFGGVCRSLDFLSVSWMENRFRASEEPLRPTVRSRGTRYNPCCVSQTGVWNRCCATVLSRSCVFRQSRGLGCESPPVIPLVRGGAIKDWRKQPCPQATSSIRTPPGRSVG